ncbi:MAG: type II toxin-antitoxin system VapC family toxin [Candidatus Kariarchaeaceae archaeon]
MILLDSDVLIEILSKRSERGKKALEKIKQQKDRDISISSLVYQEVLFGIVKTGKLEEIPTSHPINNFPVVNFTKNDAKIAALIEYEMEKRGKKKPRGDVLIAATTIRTKSKLFTYNKKHYDEIPELEMI